MQRLRAIFGEIERLCAARRWHRIEAAMLRERGLMCVADGRLPEAGGYVQRLEAQAAARAQSLLLVEGG